MPRSINQIYRAAPGGGPPSYITSQNRKALAPFVLFDAGKQKGENWLRIPWHPHSGVATLTFPYECNLHHTDTENRGMIQDGGFQWMASGGGIWHKEEYQPKHNTIGILQLWVQLPPEEESGPVKYFNVQPAQVPKTGNTRVFIGNYNGVTSPALVPVDMTYLDVSLKAGERWAYTPPKSQTRGFIFPREGSVRVAETQVEEATMGTLEETEGEIIVKANVDTKFILAVAQPSPYPIVHEYGQMHTNPESLKRAKVKIQALGKKILQQVGVSV